jgi:minor fimbrial subunit
MMTTWTSLCFRSAFLVMAMASALLITDAEAEADSSVNITANVLASPCAVSADSLDKPVDLGSVWTSKLKQAGDTSDWVSFDISVIDCPVTTTQATLKVTGTPDETNQYYKNDGTSQHVAIEVANEAGSLPNGATFTATVDTLHQATFAMKSRMVAQDDAATSGTVSGLLELSFTYR